MHAQFHRSHRPNCSCFVLFVFTDLQLRKAVMDHVSDSFLETNVPLLVLIEAAKNGNEKEVKEYAQVFREHANKLIEVIKRVYFNVLSVKF